MRTCREEWLCVVLSAQALETGWGAATSLGVSAGHAPLRPGHHLALGIRSLSGFLMDKGGDQEEVTAGARGVAEELGTGGVSASLSGLAR